MKRNSHFMLSCVLAMSFSLFVCSAYTQSLVAFKDASGKYGFKNKSGKIVVPAKYDIVGVEMSEDFQFSEGFISVKLNGKWGFMDSTGKEIAAPKYDEVGFFRSGYAEVKKNGKYGFINTAGKEVTPVKYQKISISFNSFVAVQQNDKWGFVNSKGKEIVSPKYQNVHSFFENLAAVKLNDKWGFVDTAGKEIIAPQYDEIRHDFIKTGKARVKKDGQSFYIDNPLLNTVQPEKKISIYIAGTKFNHPNEDRDFTALRDYLTKQMKKNIQQSYSQGTPAAIILAYNGSAKDLWNYLPASIKQPFELSSISATSIILKLKSVSTENNSEPKTDTTTNTKKEAKTNEVQKKNAVSPVIPSSSIILPANVPKTPVVMNGGIDESIPGLWTATYPNGMKVYFEFKKDGMYVFYTGDYSPTNASNHKCYWRVDVAFMETFCAGAAKVDRSRYVKGYDAANKPTLKIDETIFFPADKKISW